MGKKVKKPMRRVNQQFYDLKRLTSELGRIINGNSKNLEQYISKIYSKCLEIATFIGAFDRLDTYTYNEKNENYKEADHKQVFSNVNIKEHFNSAKDRGIIDMCFNLLYLSNKISKLLMNDAMSDFELNQNMPNIYKAKGIALNALIACHNNGESILIEKKQDNDEKEVYYVALPNYFEPVSVHMGKAKVDELSQNDDIGWKNISMRTLFPFFLTPEKEEELQSLIETESISEEFKEKIRWYFKMKGKFERTDAQEEISDSEKVPEQISDEVQNDKGQETEVEANAISNAAPEETPPEIIADDNTTNKVPTLIDDLIAKFDEGEIDVYDLIGKFLELRKKALGKGETLKEEKERIEAKVNGLRKEIIELQQQHRAKCEELEKLIERRNEVLRQINLADTEKDNAENAMKYISGRGL